MGIGGMWLEIGADGYVGWPAADYGTLGSTELCSSESSNTEFSTPECFTAEKEDPSNIESPTSDFFAFETIKLFFIYRQIV